MPRLPRIDDIGYYHVLNRGVARRDIFLDDADHEEFLRLIEELRILFHFNLHAYALMDNHYHLLIEITQCNLSQIMKQLSQRYSHYFNKKYVRVGPLWQGRFKSWYVYDEAYLDVVTRYIENNPIKANITSKVGLYRWASAHSSEEPWQERDVEILQTFASKKISRQADEAVVTSVSVPLSTIFKLHERNNAIYQALKAGYKQSDIALFLHLSEPAVSKIVATQKRKEALFQTLQKKGLFWSYSKTATLEEIGEHTFMEHTLKYADMDELRTLFALYGKRQLFKVWSERLQRDMRFKKLNLLLARVFFNMDVEADYFKPKVSEREQKLRMLAS